MKIKKKNINKYKQKEKQDKILKAVGIDESNIVESKRERKPKKKYLTYETSFIGSFCLL